MFEELGRGAQVAAERADTRSVSPPSVCVCRTKGPLKRGPLSLRPRRGERAPARPRTSASEPGRSHRVILGAFQSARHFTPATARRYARLVERSAFVGAFGNGLSDAPAAGVRGASLHADEQLAGE